jgi:hypothetical protein
MKNTALPSAPPKVQTPVRQAFCELKQAAHNWLEQLAELLEGDDISAGAIQDAGKDEAIRLELSLQSDTLLAIASLVLDARPSTEPDLTEFVIKFHVRRMVGLLAWIPLSLPPELATVAQALKGGKSPSLVAAQLIEQLESVPQTEYLLFFEDLAA